MLIVEKFILLEKYKQSKSKNEKIVHTKLIRNKSCRKRVKFFLIDPWGNK